MNRAELEAAIQRLVDAELAAARAEVDVSRTAGLIAVRRELQDARADLDALLDVLDHELALLP